jgi:hypothetical protein
MRRQWSNGWYRYYNNLIYFVQLIAINLNHKTKTKFYFPGLEDLNLLLNLKNTSQKPSAIIREQKKIRNGLLSNA